jgi:hypothetical protein
MSIALDQINLLAIILGGILYMVYGGVYYSVLLSDKQAGKNKEILQHQSDGPLKYIYSVIIAFVISFLMAILVQAVGAENLSGGLGLGFIIGVVITLVYIKNALFGLMSKRSLFIAIGDHLVVFTLLGALHGLLN